MKMKAFTLLLFLLIISSSFILAAPPELPMIVSGDVYINDKPAKVGTIVSVKIDGEEITNTEISAKGEYTLLLQYNTDKLINVYVNGINTNKTVEWVPGKVEEINLSITQETPINNIQIAFVGLIILGLGFLIWKRKLMPKRRKK